MARPKTVSKSSQSGPGQIAPPTILVVDPGNAESSDGLSLYRALSRQHTGDPMQYIDTMNAVLDQYLRIWVNPIHPNHDAVREYNNRDFDQVGTFFNALACPDAVLPKDWPDVMEFIADVLNIQLCVWSHQADTSTGEPSYQRLGSYGKAIVPAYHVQSTQVESSGFLEHTITQFDCLIQDETGKTLLTFLRSEKGAMNTERLFGSARRRYNGLEMKLICWWWKTADNSAVFQNRQDGAYKEKTRDNLTLRWYNEYEANGPAAPRLDDFVDSLCVYTVSVTEPCKIEPALRLLTRALEMAPAQEIPVIQELKASSNRALRRYVGIDTGFASRTATIDYSNTEGSEEELRNGATEQLCSVLTIAVDRHLVFNFYILDMLEHPTKETVPKLSELFDVVLFRHEYLKVWWNYGEDFKVLNATIAHMFQGTPRERFLEHLYGGAVQWVQPTFKITSKYYDAERPRNLTFSRDDVDCTLHLPGGDDLGMTCPCRLGNVDLSTILDHICRQLNLQTGINHYNEPDRGEIAKQWFVPKKYNSYKAVLQNLLGEDRLFPLLNHLKEAPKSRSRFNKSLGSGMKVDIHKMGYDIGDVVGVALVMRFLTTTDDRKLLAGRLLNSAFLSGGKEDPTRYLAPPSIPQRLLPRQVSTGNFPLIEDNPRLWRRDQFRLQLIARANPFGLEPIDNHFANRDIDTAWDFYVRHEEVVRIGREKFTQTRQNSRAERRSAAFRAAYEDIFDPTRFSLPEDIFTSGLPQGHVDLSSLKALVRTGKSHSDDLVDFIRSVRSRSTIPPRGFLIQPGQNEGLPPRFHRRAGDSLADSHEIWEALHYRATHRNHLQRRPSGTGHSFGQERPVQNEFGEEATAAPGNWDYDRQQQALRGIMEADRQREGMEGVPSEYHEENLFDPEGRQHNHNITSQGVENWQVYSKYDIATPQSEGLIPVSRLSRFQDLLNDNNWDVSKLAVAHSGTTQLNPATQAGEPAQGSSGGKTAVPPSAAGTASAADTQGSNQGQGSTGNGGNGTGIAQGVQNLGLRNAFAIWKKPTSHKRTRFSDEYQYKHQKGEDGTRTSKIVKVC
ncbi:MAG: hypothetical protein M1830_005535 [Pleopsidium flavum]|nr:MAG: hypothetical protein M1830_005535 [Pleopsidium flavum]